MLLKSADDKSKRLALLEDLQKSTLLDNVQRKWLRDEYFRTKKGIQGEKDAAHYLDSYFKGGENHVLLHDLRLVVDGEVAQIDHLVISRAAGIYLIETKNFSGNLVINEHGEFTVQYDEDRFGIESPIEQSMRHERILIKLLDQLKITSRTGEHPNFHHVVLLHPKAIITRPDPKLFDTSNVIKADQFPSWHKRFADSLGVVGVLTAMLNVRSLETIKDWGERLKRQHAPADLLRLPDFMTPKPPKSAPMPSAERAASAHAMPANAPRPAPQDPRAFVPPARTSVTSETSATQAATPAPERRLICATCGSKISFAEGKFCWNNGQRFGGLQYCREHQQQFK